MSKITEVINPNDLLFGTMKQLMKFLKNKNYDVMLFIEDLINNFMFDKDYITDIMDDLIKHNLFICVINPDCIEKYKSNAIIGYIQIQKYSRKNIKYIEFCDTFTPKNNILTQMINAYELQNENKLLLPFIISRDAKIFWYKYFNRKFNIKTKYDIKIFKEKHNITKNLMTWNRIFEPELIL